MSSILDQARNLWNNFNKPITASGRGVAPNLQPTIKNVFNQAINQPLISTPKPGLGINIPQFNNPAPFSPTIKQYTQGQIIQPIKQGFQQLSQRNLIGALPVAGGIFAATPVGAAWNIGTGAVAGIGQSVRTKQPLNQSIRSAIAQPSSVATQGLGIQNPFLAGAVDLSLGLNPKSAVNALGNIKNARVLSQLIKSAPKHLNEQIASRAIANAKNLDMNDYNLMKTFAAGLQGSKGAKGQIKAIALDAQRVAEGVFGPQAANWTNQKMAKAFNWYLQVVDKAPGFQKNAIPNLSFMGKNQVKGTGARIATQGEKRIAPTEQIVPPSNIAQKTSPLVFPPENVNPVGGILKSSGGEPPPFSVVQKSPSKYAYNINLNKMQINPEEKQVFTSAVNVAKPELEKLKGATLSNKEVIKAAKTSEVLQQVTTREQTMAAEAAMLKARQGMVGLDQEITAALKTGNTQQAQARMRDLVDSLRVVSSNAADTGRKLQSLAIQAGDESIRIQILKEIGKVSNNMDEILKEAGKVDWNNAGSVAKFYRKFVKPTLPEILDEFRYNNMLSNPKTHLRNAFSNTLQTLVTRPVTLAAEGRPIEAAKYFSGVAKNIPTAVNEFVDSFRGKTVIEKPDLVNQIPTGKIPGILTIPTRLLEAGDRFFSALIKGGEIARGATPEKAAKTAEYFLFRQGLKPEGQGTILNAIDDMTAWLYKSPKAVRWFVPFIRTPMNFAKQWIEYSPAGATTLLKAGNPREQLAKTMLGSLVTTYGAHLALENRTTWAVPTDQKEKELFYASGKKPFSILIGDKWVPMMYAGPFAFALALPAAAKFYQEDSRTAPTDDQLAKVGKTAASMAQFLSGQTFLTGLGNFVKWASGDADYTIGKNLAFTAGQVVPMKGLLSYISSVMDPIYRKANGFGEAFIKDIPGLSQNLEPYREPSGEPSRRLPENYIAPYDVGRRQPFYEQPLENRQQKLQINNIFNTDLKSFTVIDSEIKSLVKAGKVDQARTLLSENKDILLRGKIIKAFESRYTKYYTDMDKISNMYNVDPERKKKALAVIQARIKQLDAGYKKFKSEKPLNN